jgi:hypothetical protein
MAERFTSKNLARRAYVPEDRPGYQEYISDPENQRMAEEAALGLLSLFSGPLGQVPRAISLAKNLGRGSQLIPRPDRGNAMRPEEMLQLEGPPARQLLPKPSRPQMTEDEMQAMELARMVGEGGRSMGTQEAARRAVRRRPSEEEMQAMERARMEGEGGVDPAQAALMRALREQRERAQREEDIMRFEGEGGGAYNYTGPRYKYGLPANMGGRDVINYSQPGGLPTMAGGRGGGDLLSPSMRFSRDEGPTALPPPMGGGPRVAGSQGAGDSPMYGFSNFRTNVPYGIQPPNPLRSALALTAPMDGSAMMPPAGGMAMGTGTPPEGGVGSIRASSEAERAEINALIEQQAREAEERAAQEAAMLDQGSYRDAAPPAASPARSAPTRSAPSRSAPSQPAGPNIAALWEDYNRTQNPGDFVRADRAMMEAMKSGRDIGYYGQDEGRKSGGAVKGKDDAVHKALDIIQHLISR